MRESFRHLLLSITLAVVNCSGLAPVSAWAAQHNDRVVVAEGNGMTLAKAVRRVQRSHGGRIVSAHTETRGKREVHVIKVLTDQGRVQTVHVPGRQLNQRRN